METAKKAPQSTPIQLERNLTSMLSSGMTCGSVTRDRPMYNEVPPPSKSKTLFLSIQMIQQHLQAEMADLSRIGNESMERLLYCDDLHKPESRQMYPTNDLCQVPSCDQFGSLMDCLTKSPSYPCSGEFCQMSLEELDNQLRQPDPLQVCEQSISQKTLQEIRPERSGLLGLGSPNESFPELSRTFYPNSPQWSLPAVYEHSVATKAKRTPRKPAWKPNNDQLRILDRYLNSRTSLFRRRSAQFV